MINVGIRKCFSDLPYIDSYPVSYRQNIIIAPKSLTISKSYTIISNSYSCFTVKLRYFSILNQNETIVMKRFFVIICIGIVMTVNAVAQTKSSQGSRIATSANRNHGKVLVAYFSVPETDGIDASSGASRVSADGKIMGNTQYVASVISEATGGDLFEIMTALSYPGTHKDLIDAAKRENDNNTRPKLATHISNLKDYDVVFVGFPNWWYDMPMPLYSFFEEYDFSGKTVVPFCTHGGSSFSDAVRTIRGLEKNATVLDGYAIARDRVPESKDGVLRWLDKIGMTK